MGRKRLPNKAREFLDSCGHLYAVMEQQVASLVNSLSDEASRAVAAEIKTLNQTNCWWAAYGVRDTVSRALMQREQKRKREGVEA